MIAPASCAYPFCVAARDTDIHVICGANQCIGKCLTEYGKQCHEFVELRTYESGEVTQSGAVPMSVSSTVAATDQAERESLPRADYLIARKSADGLLPCPFCGWEEPQPQFDAAAPDEDPCLNNGYVHCLECGAFGPTGSTPEEGVELWNERSTAAVSVVLPNAHPDQPLINVDGVIRFKKNSIVRYLLDAGPFNLNQLAALTFTDDDRNQFAQLVGYSVAGFGELSYADADRVRRADVLADAMIARTEAKDGE